MNFSSYALLPKKTTRKTYNVIVKYKSMLIDMSHKTNYNHKANNN